MNTISMTAEFTNWLERLRDAQAKKRVINRIDRAEEGNFGDCHDYGDGVWAMRIDHGPGYRLYYGRTGETVYLLLAGGDKRTQDADVARAKAMWNALKKGAGS